MVQEEILELTSDTLFKAFMVSPNTNAFKARLIHLITGIDEKLLLKAEYQSVELPVKHENDKVYRSDVIVKVDKHLLNIEMNTSYYPEYKIKNTEYVHVIASQLFESGDKYDGRFVCQINIDDFDVYGLDELIYECRLMEIKYHIIEDKNYALYHINLSKIENLCYTNDEQMELVNILKMFKATNEEELDRLRSKDYMDEAINEMKRICRDEKIIGLYNAEKVAKKEMNTRLDYAEQKGFEKGHVVGYDEGHGVGYDEGHDVGYDEGRLAEKIELARNMLAENSKISFISKVTGLTEKQIEELK